MIFEQLLLGELARCLSSHSSGVEARLYCCKKLWITLLKSLGKTLRGTVVTGFAPLPGFPQAK